MCNSDSCRLFRGQTGFSANNYKFKKKTDFKIILKIQFIMLNSTH